MKPVAQSPALSRRTALACLLAAPTTAQAGAAPGVETTPVMALFAQYMAFRAWMNELPVAMSDKDMEPLYGQLCELEAEMMAAPSQSAADFAAKAIVDSAEGDFAHDWENSAFWREARGLTGYEQLHVRS